MRPPRPDAALVEAKASVVRAKIEVLEDKSVAARTPAKARLYLAQAEVLAIELANLNKQAKHLRWAEDLEARAKIARAKRGW